LSKILVRLRQRQRVLLGNCVTGAPMRNDKRYFTLYLSEQRRIERTTKKSTLAG
jgi:hypothetical protein